MAGRQGDRRYEFVDALVEIGVAELRKTGAVPDDQAKDLMLQIAQDLCARYARTVMYIPSLLDLELTKRNKEIWREYGQPGEGPMGARAWTPARVAELAVKYQLTTVQIYTIVKRMHQAEVGRLQGQLPGLDVGEGS